MNTESVSSEGLLLKEEDYIKLSALVAGVPLADSVRKLEEELGRATIIPATSFPDGVVAMNSTVRYQEVDSGKTAIATVVYPHEANLSENKVSVLAPIGSALIGLRSGQEIVWSFPNGKSKRLRVLDVQSN